MNRLVVLGLLLATSIFATPYTPSVNPKTDLSFGDVAKVVEGMLVGILEEQFTGLDTCIQDVDDIEYDVKTAVEDFEKETFDAIRSGIKRLGSAIRLIPKTV